MRRLPIIAGATLTCLLLAPVLPGNAEPSHDQAVGNGTIADFGNPTVHVNANDNNSGVKGGFTITYPDGTSVKGRATCLSVAANTAYLTGLVTKASGPRRLWDADDFIVIGVQDNAAGPDLLNFSPGFDADPGCGPNGAAIPTIPIVEGDYRVTDAT
jgi:hypothetical protein